MLAPAMLPSRARIFIALVVAAGFALLTGCLVFRSQFPDLPRYTSYLFLAAVASTLKVRLPGITGTMSVNFLFILIGIADFTMAQTLTMGCAAIVVQCLWRASRQPRPIQVAFNVAALAISIAAAYQVSHFVLMLARADSLSALLVMAACTFFLSNTLLVSGVLCLVEGQPLKRIWQHCYLWSFPYYLAGCAIAGLVTVSGRTLGWQPALLILPLMYLTYTFYRLCLKRANPDLDQLTSNSSAA
jgi:hypothetical protein